MRLTGHYIREGLRAKRELEESLTAQYRTNICTGCGGEKSASISESFFSILCDGCQKVIRKVDREKAKLLKTAYHDDHSELLAWALDILHADPAINPPKILVSSITPWFGGKRTLAPDIVAELGKHTQYFEPFCGSMAVLFEKQQSQKETVSDLHGDLINLAKIVQDVDKAPVLYERLQRVLFCDALLIDAQKTLEAGVVSDPVERAYWYFIASWMGRNGTAGTQRRDYQLAVRWTKSGGSPTVRFRNAIDSIPAWHERLRNVVILKRDAFEIINRFEDIPETAIYVDPPYMAETRGSHDNRKDGFGRYLHDFSHDGDGIFAGVDDHQRLAGALKKYKKARIVVSYYDCPRVRELYAGWTFIEKTRQKNLHAQNGRGMRPKDAPELLIISGPSYAGQGEPHELRGRGNAVRKVRGETTPRNPHRRSKVPRLATDSGDQEPAVAGSGEGNE